MDGMQFMFNTEQHACWKNPYMVELDETIGDIHGAITGATTLAVPVVLQVPPSPPSQVELYY